MILDGARRVGPLAAVALALVVAVVGIDPSTDDQAAGDVPGVAGGAVHHGGGPIDAGGGRSGEREAPGRVVIVSLPTLRWADVAEHRPPTILDVVERSAVASLSIRTIGPRTDAGEAYTTIGAGNRATVSVDVSGLAYEPTFPLELGTAGEVYERRTATPVDGAAVVHLGIAWVREAADSMRYGAEPGALGDALADQGLSTAVVANADVQGVAHRDAALAVMDGDGRVSGGTVSADLLSPDRAAAFGTQLDPEATAREARRALEDHDVVLVEASDLARVEDYWLWMTQDAALEARRRAIAAADQLVADVVASLDLDRDMLMLVGPTAPGSTPQLTVFTVAGPGIEPGWARSGRTRRAGFVTLPDVAPTVLDHFGIEKPDAMTGTPVLSSGGGPPDRTALGRLVDTNEVAVFRDRAAGTVSLVYIVGQVAFYVLAVVALARGATAGWRRVVVAGACVLLAIPPLAFLSGLVRYDELGVAGYIATLLTAAVVLAALAWWSLRRHPLGPPLGLIGLTLAVLVVDVITGGRLQINTVLGYSPIVAGRFAGLGNQAFALVGISAVTVSTALWAALRPTGTTGRVDATTRARARRGWLWWATAASLAAVAVTIGYPSWGADVGGVLASIPAFGVVLLLLAGTRLDWRRVAGLAAAPLLALAVFAAVDLSRPETQRTHLGRFVQRLGDGSALSIISRKLDANIDILTSTVWAWLVPAGVLFLVVLVRHQRARLAALRRRVPGVTAFWAGGLTIALVGMAVNDSGIVVPATMAGIALPYLTYLAVLTDVDDRPGSNGATGPVATAVTSGSDTVEPPTPQRRWGAFPART